MRISYLVRHLSVLLMALLLGACAAPSKRADMGGKEGLYTQGLGETVGYISESRFHHASKEAPANQTYYFAFDSSDIYPEYYTSLKAQAAYLADHPKARVVIEGHTDSRGSREYNVGLGERRAKSIANALMAEGASANQIRIVSYGKERLVTLGDTEKDHQKNRRANIIYENVG